MTEEWRDIIDYEGFYQVSNYGRVRSLDRVINKHFYKGRILKQVSNGQYLYIKLSKNSIWSRFSVHRLVAIMFLGFDTSSGLEINHIDHNKLNNRLDNLEIVTHEENMDKAFKFYNGVSNRYGHHKIRNINHCIDCGKEIFKSSKRCVECESKRRRKLAKYNVPNGVINSINTIGICATAKKYNVSYHTIRKWVERLGEVV